MSNSSANHRTSFFLPRIPPEVAQDYCAVVLQRNLTKADIADKIIAWVKQQGPRIVAAYSKWARKQKDLQRVFERRKKLLTRRLSKEASFINNEIEAILHDRNYTIENEEKKIAEIFNRSSAAVKEELNAIDAALFDGAKRSQKTSIMYYKNGLLQGLETIRTKFDSHSDQMNRAMGKLFGKNCDVCR